jgi:hypothetical protein
MQFLGKRCEYTVSVYTAYLFCIPPPEGKLVGPNVLLVCKFWLNPLCTTFPRGVKKSSYLTRHKICHAMFVSFLIYWFHYGDFRWSGRMRVFSESLSTSLSAWLILDMQVFKILYLFHHNLLIFLICRNLLCILPLSGWNNFKPWEISRKTFFWRQYISCPTSCKFKFPVIIIKKLLKT